MTQDDLKSILRYDPNTGFFFWLVSNRNGTIRIGDRAGTIKSSYKGNIRIGYEGTEYQSARLAFLYMTGEWPLGWVRFLDGNNRNLSWDNLVDSTWSEVQAARKTNKNNTYGFGVSKDEKNRRKKIYRARFRLNNKTIYAGSFKTAEEAEIACEIKRSQLL